MKKTLALADQGRFEVFKFRHVLTPIAIDWVRYFERLESVTWSILYVFGFRIARWRRDVP